MSDRELLAGKTLPIATPERRGAASTFFAIEGKYFPKGEIPDMREAIWL
jgi:hypothetical protein